MVRKDEDSKSGGICSDCGKDEDVIIKCSGPPWVPEGQVGYFDPECAKIRIDEYVKGLPTRDVGQSPKKAA